MSYTTDYGQIRRAELETEPYVGAVAASCAESVYRIALDRKGVSCRGVNLADVNLAGLRGLWRLARLDGKTAPIAMDAAATKAYAERFPHANRLR